MIEQPKDEQAETWDFSWATQDIRADYARTFRKMWAKHEDFDAFGVRHSLTAEQVDQMRRRFMVIGGIVEKPVPPEIPEVPKSLRDYFAAAALQGMLANSGNKTLWTTTELDHDCKSCYVISDAMIRAREVKSNPKGVE